MARVWREEYDAGRHANRMVPWDFAYGEDDAGSLPETSTPLRRRWVYLVRVCGFTFEFHTLGQVRAAHRFYSAKLLPSGRLPVDGGGDVWEYLRWHERLPGELRRESKRVKVVKALEDAFERIANGELGGSGA